MEFRSGRENNNPETHEMDFITGGTQNDPAGPYGASTTVQVMIFDDPMIKKNFLRRILLWFLLQVTSCLVFLYTFRYNE